MKLPQLQSMHGLKKYWKKPTKKNMFWAWVTYQAVKGIITTTLIWVPLFYMWLKHN